MTKQQQIDVLRTENEQLRALLAKSIADHAAEKAVLDRKLFQLNSERSKWEARARAAQYQHVTGSTFAERAAMARALAMSTGRPAAVGGV